MAFDEPAGTKCARYVLDQTDCDNEATHYAKANPPTAKHNARIPLCGDHEELEDRIADFMEATRKL